jgi:hypothetical protein
MLAHLGKLVKRKIAWPREGRENVALPPGLGKGFERVKKSLACHPERSEGSPQLLLFLPPTKNCRDASLRSA